MLLIYNIKMSFNMNNVNNCSGQYVCPPTPMLRQLPSPGPVPFLQLENSNDISTFNVNNAGYQTPPAKPMLTKPPSLKKVVILNTPPDVVLPFLSLD